MVKFVLSTSLAFGQFVCQVMLVIYKKALFLDEIDEHQAIEHYRRIPTLQLVIRDALCELQECIVLFLEEFVELLRDLLNVECRPHSDNGFGDIRLIIQAERDRLNLLNERIPRLPRVKQLLPTRRMFA